MGQDGGVGWQDKWAGRGLVTHYDVKRVIYL